ncbi:hypothetical protein NM688_g3364 [Phlebia brevispora]|uniref:Uncharacterized protein n=1 Tax=Phlebia brevispora TaxID=194682 RepID=A0ACC1T5R7_9APHY|nr:hypothetical protein NM688_g3364 [Phlebia brevispora]
MCLHAGIRDRSPQLQAVEYLMFGLVALGSAIESPAYDCGPCPRVYRRLCPSAQGYSELASFSPTTSAPIICHMGWYGDLEVIQPSQLVVMMEVPRAWRLWSGWKPSGYWNVFDREYIYKDPMDEETFDEPTAFPALKPNFDIFGPPSSSRRQRGWYYVKPWPLPLAIKEDEGNEAPASGVNVPPELFDTIIQSFSLIAASNTVHTNKQELGRVALVCHRWANILLPKIYERLMLQSREDVDTLLSLVEEPHSHIAQHITKVELAQSVVSYPYLPWIHNVPSKILRQLHHLHELTMSMSGPLPLGKFTRSVCDMLPRSTPWSFSGIVRLELKNLHFQHLGDLIRIPRELPLLHEVDCSDVTWDSTEADQIPFVLPCLTKSNSPPEWREYTYMVRGCTDNAISVWFAALLSWRRRDRMKQPDAQCICGIASALVQNIDASKFPGHEFVAERQDDFLYFYANNFETRLIPSIRMYFTPYVTRQGRHVHAITIDFEYTTVSLTRGYSDWKAVDRLGSTLPKLKVLLFAFPTHQDALHFHKEVMMQEMPRFNISKKYKYLVLTEDRRWIQISYFEGKMRATGHRVPHWDAFVR